MSTEKSIPLGFTLRHTLRGHVSEITRIAWSPDGKFLASTSIDRTIHIWDGITGTPKQILTGHTDGVYCVAWSPDGKTLASASFDSTVRLWNAETGDQLHTFREQESAVFIVAWSSDGRILASGSQDNTVRLWDAETGNLLHTLVGHYAAVTGIAWAPYGYDLASGSDDSTIRLWNGKTGKLYRMLEGHNKWVNSIAWSSDGQTLVSSSSDQTIRFWNVNTGQLLRILEGHTSAVGFIAISHNGELLASNSNDGKVWLWDFSTGKSIAELKGQLGKSHFCVLTFHPKVLRLATLDAGATIIHVWDLDIATLLKTASITPAVYYTNAKIVLVGESRVGKSGLGLVLTGQRFAPTESTHGRRVWILESREVELDNKLRETREILLWDLAGQSEYRLIHQLYLGEVNLALIVFDPISDNNYFSGLYYWDRSLRQIHLSQGNIATRMKKFLVAARVDREGASIASERLDSLKQKLSFDGYFQTSAKEGLNIAELTRAIKEAIDWVVLPRVSSTIFFQQIKLFLYAEKGTGRLLSTIDDLYRAFLLSNNTLPKSQELRTLFETSIVLIESQDLIRRLSFGNLVLLQPEVLDVYASSLINSLKNETDDLDSIREEEVKNGGFPVPREERLKDTEQEKLLLIAMIEDLVRHDIILREYADDGSYLIFPSQSTRERPTVPEPEGREVIFDFEGAILNIYATLAVRLSHSGLFQKEETWKNAMTYTARTGGICGMFLRDHSDGHGELTLFFDRVVSEETCFHFEEYVQTHLQRRALPASIRRRRVFACFSCATSFTETQVVRRRERGYNWLLCCVCNTQVFLLDGKERLAISPTSRISDIDNAADTQRERSAAVSVLQGKKATNDFDVFLCHRSVDKPEVKKIGEQLKVQGILPWLDEWELRPGLPWQRVLEKQIGQIKSAVVFVGKDGIGPWEQMELEALLRQFMKRECPVIPVILTEVAKEPQLPIFLEGMTWVDFRQQDSDPMERLIWGITGKRGIHR